MVLKTLSKTKITEELRRKLAKWLRLRIIVRVPTVPTYRYRYHTEVIYIIHYAYRTIIPVFWFRLEL